MTLGELKDAGNVPELWQIRMLEIEESKKCNYMGCGVHTFHVTKYPTYEYRIVCWHIQTLHRNLEEMFPALGVEHRYKT